MPDRTITVNIDKTLSIDDNFLAVQGEQISVDAIVPAALYSLGYDAYIDFLLPDGSAYFKGAYDCSSGTVSFSLGAVDSILDKDGDIYIQFVLATTVGSVRTAQWKSIQLKTVILPSINATSSAILPYVPQMVFPNTYPASNVVIADVGNIITATNTEDALQEAFTSINSINANPFTIEVDDVAFVEVNGNDSTGEVNNPAKPFATLDAAMDSLTAGTVKVGFGTFARPSNNKWKDNLNLIGSGVPRINSTRTALEGGTIIRGHIGIVNCNNNEVAYLGVDVGSAVCATYYGGVAQEGFVTSSDDSSHVLVDPNTGKNIHDLCVLCKDATSLVHACLIEGVINANVYNIETCYGVHGLVLKALRTNASHIITHDHGQDGIIIKADSYAHCSAVNLSEFVIDATVSTYGGLRLDGEANDTTLDGLNIQNGIIVGCAFGIAIESEVLTYLINIANIQIYNATNAITMTGICGFNAFNNILITGNTNNGIVLSAQSFNNVFNNIVMISSNYSTGGTNVSGNGVTLNGSGHTITNLTQRKYPVGILLTTTDHRLSNFVGVDNTANFSGSDTGLYIDGVVQS